MNAVIYVETNFLMSVAMGREGHGDDLLVAASDTVRIAIPAGCFMESFSALEDERKRRKRFKSDLDQQISQLERDITSLNARTLLKHLELSRVANGDLLNDIENRLFQFIDRAAGVLTVITETPTVLRLTVNDPRISDPTDNLILHAILDDATRFPSAKKALLTDNIKDFATPEIEALLDASGIDGPIRKVTDVLGWLGSISP